MSIRIAIRKSKIEKEKKRKNKATEKSGNIKRNKLVGALWAGKETERKTDIQ